MDKEGGREGREVVKGQFLYCSRRGRECRINIELCKRDKCKLVPVLVDGYYHCPKVVVEKKRVKKQ